MRGITIKLPEPLLEQLAAEARAAGKSIAAIVREKLEAATPRGPSAYDLAGDLVGSVKGSGRSATNDRKKFRRSW